MENVCSWFWSGSDALGLAAVLSCEEQSQRAFVEEVLDHQLSLRYPVNTAFKAKVLRAYLARIDENNAAVDEQLLVHYMQCCANTCKDMAQDCGMYLDKSLSYLIYCMPDGQPIHLGLRKSFADVGETVWTAAYALASFALSGGMSLKGKRVLELGSGTGLTGLCIAACMDPQVVVLSDYLDNVLDLLRSNAKQCADRCQVKRLDWYEEVPPLEDLGGPFDVVIGADLTYDAELAPPLARTCRALARAHEEQRPQFFLAATLRSENTYQAFQDAFQSAGFSATEVADETCVDRRVFRVDTPAPILVQQFSLNH